MPHTKRTLWRRGLVVEGFHARCLFGRIQLAPFRAVVGVVPWDRRYRCRACCVRRMQIGQCGRRSSMRCRRTLRPRLGRVSKASRICRRSSLRAAKPPAGMSARRSRCLSDRCQAMITSPGRTRRKIALRLTGDAVGHGTDSLVASLTYGHLHAFAFGKLRQKGVDGVAVGLVDPFDVDR